jgi:hypothetical protein
MFHGEAAAVDEPARARNSVIDVGKGALERAGASAEVRRRLAEGRIGHVVVKAALSKLL